MGLTLLLIEEGSGAERGHEEMLSIITTQRALVEGTSDGAVVTGAADEDKIGGAELKLE